METFLIIDIEGGLIIFYVLNAMLLLLHEIESAYEKEWEILKLPGKITGFLLMHIPIILFLFWGLIEIYEHTTTGMTVGIITGIGGLIPFVVHKLLMKRNKCFNRMISNSVMILNIITGIGTITLSVIGWN